jgi:hypothetical protein
MKGAIYLILVIALFGNTVATQSEEFSKLRRMFDYDRKIAPIWL